MRASILLNLATFKTLKLGASSTAHSKNTVLGLDVWLKIEVYASNFTLFALILIAGTFYDNERYGSDWISLYDFGTLGKDADVAKN